MDTLNYLSNQFIDQVKGEIEAWSQKGSGWVIDEILEAFINIAQYRPLRQYMHKMKILRSEGHEMHGMCMNKISLSPFDTKRWIADDGIHTLAYGHRAIRRVEAVY